MCVAGSLKLVNAYASSATQAAGRVWSEVWRQAFYLLLIVAGIYLLRRQGPAGAAAAVLIATTAMSVLMHLLLRRVTHLTWREIVEPQLPSVAAAAIVAAVAALTARGVMAIGAPNDLVLLVVQSLSAAIVYACFVLFAPFPALRRLVHEIASDLAPSFVKRQWWLKWYLRTHAAHGEPTTP
jgi:hypothetical protein